MPVSTQLVRIQYNPRVSTTKTANAPLRLKKSQRVRLLKCGRHAAVFHAPTSFPCCGCPPDGQLQQDTGVPSGRRSSRTRRADERPGG